VILVGTDEPAEIRYEFVAPRDDETGPSTPP
jgi:hypothetical protein